MASASSPSTGIIIYIIVGGSVILNLLSTPIDAKDDVDALTAVKHLLKDPQNALSSWDPTLDSPCTWFHGNCNDASTVTRVYVMARSLSGPLSPRICQLSSLKYLQFQQNSLHGPLPPCLGNLKNLVSLDLHSNRFTGQIPSSLAHLSKLKFLDLSNNRLSGIVPASLSNYESKSFKGNSGICGKLVNKTC